MKALEVIVVDPQTEKKIPSTFDAAVIVAVQKVTRAGVETCVVTTQTGASFAVDESYESLRKRWLLARDDQELVEIAAPKPRIAVQ
jgi:hypothetical protein